MQLIIKDGYIIASHENSQDIAHLYPDTECILWNEPLKFNTPEEGPTPDPRSVQQKKENYKDKRRNAYPSIPDQLDMMFKDKVNGTTTWVDTINDIKIRYPKEE